MKYLNQLLTLLIAAITFSACKKDEIKAPSISSINITNAIVSGTTAKFGTNTSTISNNNFRLFGLKAGVNQIYIYPSNDTLHPYYNNTITTNNGDVYSLFLSGTTAQIDTILIKENIPYRTDSTAGIRFINLAPSSNPLNITLSASPTVNEVSNLSYKQHTAFKSYSGKYNDSYVFQVRDASNPVTVLATYSLPTQFLRFANLTFVIRQNGSGVAVFAVQNDR